VGLSRKAQGFHQTKSLASEGDEGPVKHLLEVAQSEAKAVLDASTKEELGEIIRAGGRKVREEANSYSPEVLESAEDIALGRTSEADAHDPAFAAYRIIAYARQVKDEGK
jgi:hypothetical protein